MYQAPNLETAQQSEMQQQQPQYNPNDEVALAKQALGLDGYEQQMQQQSAQLQQMQSFMQEQQNKAVYNEVSSRYKDVPQELVQAEITKLETTNPQMAQMLKTTPEGLDMLFKKIKAESMGASKPDDITDSSGSSGLNSDFAKKAKDGTATEMDLGDFILSSNK